MTQTIEFRGIRPTDDAGREGLRNPERGLRIETLIAEPPGSAAWGPASHLKGKTTPGYSDDWWILDTQQYAEHGLTLAQTYCYLNEFVGKPIPEEKLEWLQASLDKLREHGLKAVLRFAYERDMTRRAGPDLQTILGHIDQLEPIIRRNSDVVFVMQAGFVGAWGEWHSSAQNLEGDHAALAAIVDRVLRALPADRMTQLRVPKYKRWVLEQPILDALAEVDAGSAHDGSPASRIGFNNDGFLAGTTCGGTWTEGPHYSNPGNPEFDYMTRESPFVAIDGELFWGDQGGKIDGLRAAIRLRLHHYSSFSLAHSFSEREGKPYSIDEWMQTPLTVDHVREARLPLSDGYFEDGAGGATPRTQFEYIRDHLGYRIELQEATLPRAVASGGEFRGTISLINRGFSTLHNPRPVYLLLIGDNGEAATVLGTVADPRAWQPFAPDDTEYRPLVHRIDVRAMLPEWLAEGEYRVGLWMPDPADTLRYDPRYAVRVANGGTRWWTDGLGRYGANILGSVRVTRP